MRALRCRLTAFDDDPVEVSPWTGAPTALAHHAAAGVYLVADEAMASLRMLTTLVNDRGRKHPRRPLSALLLGHARVPIAEAAFKSGRQVKRAIRALLENAAHIRERKAYVVALPSALYAELTARSGSALHDNREGTDVPLHELMDPEDVPVELERRLTGASAEMRHVRQQVVRAAREDFPVLVQGDTGTGKEVAARAIHDLSPDRCHQPFVPVNCGAISRELFEAQVFGYVGGAFTGALRRGSEGLWRSAMGGTIFLDEIGDLSLEHQVKILRALEQRAVLPVGATKEVPVQARVVAATNKDLYALVDADLFREDLYYRLASLVVMLSPLRDRPEDVQRLAVLFWSEIAPKRPVLGSEVLQELARYPWRGNARELRYILANLHMAFPKSMPTVERLRAVIRARTPDGGEGEDGWHEALRRQETLRHLRRVRAGVRSAQQLASIFRRKDAAGDRRERVLADVSGCLMELQIIGTRPERFEKLSTFEAVHRLAGGLAAFHSLLTRGDPGALRYSKKELAQEAAAALAAVQRDEARISRAG